MKIFNWIHRRFHHKYEVSQDVKKSEFTTNGKDNLSLLENEGKDNVFEGWKEGILAIGTFGFDPSLLKDFDHEDAYLCEYARKEDLSIIDRDEDDKGGDRVEEIVEEEEEVEFPLVFKACKHGFFHDHDHTQCDEVCKHNDCDQVKKGKKDGERITLADLFWGDSDKNLLNKKLTDEGQVKVNYSPPESNTKHAAYDDRVALISKKKITKDVATRPIKKINRMVRKMLKKKIHPDVLNQKDKCAFEAMRVHGSMKNA